MKNGKDCECSHSITYHNTDGSCKNCNCGMFKSPHERSLEAQVKYYQQTNDELVRVIHKLNKELKDD